MKQFLVSWIEGEDIGVYAAEDADGAILAAVQDAGYESLSRAEDFIYDEAGAITIQAVEVKGYKMSKLQVSANDVRTVQVSHYNHSDSANELIDPSVVEATGENAEPTSRVLDGSSDHGYAEEWQEPATLPDGRKCYRMYLFDESAIVDDDGEPMEAEDYPWDDEHVARILLAD